MQNNELYLQQALELAYENVKKGGRPFGAVIVKDNKLIASAVNEIHIDYDPTAHAELLAIRKASKVLKSSNLEGCIIFASGQPCPMCKSLMYLTGIKEAIYVYSNEDAEPYGLSTASIYQEFRKPILEQSVRVLHQPIKIENQPHLYEMWSSK